jgi:hypothetical protein
MSYSRGPAPDDLQLKIASDQLYLSFTCPRCDEKQEHVIDPADLLYEVSVQCSHPTCTGPGERAGYTLTMYPSWEGMELGLTDRPLYEP